MDDDNDDNKGTQGQRPYAGAGWYYAEYRGQVSLDFIRILETHLDWKPADRILDLGAGPGTLSLLVAPFVTEVIALEPEPDMLAEGERRVNHLGIGNIRFVLAGSDDLAAFGDTLGHFKTVLMGRSFHWMLGHDRVLQDLSSIVDSHQGSVAFIFQQVLYNPPELQAIRDAVRQILDRYIASVPRGPHPAGRHALFEEILGRSAFNRIERIHLDYSIRVTPTFESIVGNEYSYSYVLSRLGDRREHFEHDVEFALGNQVKQLGEVRLTLRDDALIGRRY